MARLHDGRRPRAERRRVTWPNASNSISTTVGAHVRWKRVRPALTQELRTHLEEQAEAYRAEGLPAAEAEAEAVRQMGDAEQIGLALDAVHRPKRQTAILSLAGICILLGAIFRILRQDSPKLFTLAALVLTAGLLLGGYSFDYRRLARYAWQIYGVVLALGAVCLSRSFHLANGIGIELGMSMGIENEYVVLLFPLAYALAVYALRGKRGGFVLALYAGVPFIAFLHLSDMAPIYQVSFFSRLMLRVGLTAVLLIAIRAGFFRVKAGWACAAVLALLALGVYLDVRSSASRLASYFSPEAMQLWRSLAQKQPFADQLMNRTLRQLQQAGLSSAVPAWVWMGLLFGPMAAFLALLLVRAAKLTHPLGKLLCLPAALLLVIRFVPGVLYQLSLFPLAAHRCRSSPETSIPSLTPSSSVCPSPPSANPPARNRRKSGQYSPRSSEGPRLLFQMRGQWLRRCRDRSR